MFQVGKGWLRDLPEDLDMFIAQRDFERAMELIDRSEYVSYAPLSISRQAELITTVLFLKFIPNQSAA